MKLINWRKASAASIAKELQRLKQQIMHHGHNTEVGTLLQAYVDDGATELQRRVKIVSNKDWSKSESRAIVQINGLVKLRAELTELSCVLPASLYATIDQCMEKISTTLGKTIYIDTKASPSQTSKALPLTISNLPDKIDNNGLYSLYYRVMKNGKSLTHVEIRHVDRLLKQYSRHIDEHHLLAPLINNIKMNMTLIRKKQLSLNICLKPKLNAAKLTQSQFDITSNGFALELGKVEAKVIATTEPTQVKASKFIRSVLPWFVRQYSSEKNVNFIKHSFSRGIEICEFQGQYVFEDSSPRDAVKITKKILKKQKIKSIVIWGEPHFTRDIEEYCNRKKVGIRILNEAELKVVKSRVERQVNKREVENSSQHLKINKPQINHAVSSILTSGRVKNMNTSLDLAVS